ncbi:hypothetical protein BKE38_27975 [Pseudoroseomonas deserti]|uniref:Uncharacterized protein n=1 Tax=Teichococcus deserti TaxID=1817963 RepID=A0A1V2GU16_9PROT|nr:hypothetical protein [Pseudoroseomonas deserti]ONG44605.1 hypothetical protein BKE38_27975 [Pseudoroseomonas deserti]
MLPVSAASGQQGLSEFWAQLRARAEQAAQTAGNTTTDGTADPASTAPGTVVAPGVATPDGSTRYSDETEALLVALQSEPGTAPPPPQGPPPGGAPPAAEDEAAATGAIAALKALLEALQAEAEEDAVAEAAGEGTSIRAAGGNTLEEARASSATPPEASPIGQVQGLLQSIIGQLQADRSSGAERSAETQPAREEDPDRGFRQRALAEAARAYAAQQEEGPGNAAASIFA